MDSVALPAFQVISNNEALEIGLRKTVKQCIPLSQIGTPGRDGKTYQESARPVNYRASSRKVEPSYESSDPVYNEADSDSNFFPVVFW